MSNRGNVVYNGRLSRISLLREIGSNLNSLHQLYTVLKREPSSPNAQRSLSMYCFGEKPLRLRIFFSLNFEHLFYFVLRFFSGLMLIENLFISWIVIFCFLLFLVMIRWICKGNQHAINFKLVCVNSKNVKTLLYVHNRIGISCADDIVLSSNTRFKFANVVNTISISRGILHDFKK